MLGHQAPFRFSKLWLGAFLFVSSHSFAEVKVSYGVPDGFSAAELDDSANYVATFNGKTLPGFISYSSKAASLEFDALKYASNGISPGDVDTIRSVVSQIDYKRCSKGCDVQIAGYYVTIDKLKRSISIRDTRDDYVVPETTFGLVNNQSLDLRASSDGYRAVNMNGSTWVGLPSRSFGYVNWYANRTQLQGRSSGTQGVSSYYLQKNFASTYVRAGKQNSIDYASGSVSTLLSPSFDQFVTVGSQSNFQADRNAGSLILYATAEGNYEFYRNGRLIMKRPAILGRNEISYADLPGGYYSVQVRLVDRNGNVVTQEIREINNVNFGAAGGGNAWHFTAGKEMSVRGGFLMEAAVSRNFSQFYMNASTLVGQGGDWATEVNVTRPMKIGDVDITPTLGVLSGERKAGGYVSVAASGEALGSLTASHYLNNDVSRFYAGTPSTSFSYSRNVRGATVGYNYQKSGFGKTQQAEVRWNYRPNGLWGTFALGVQKGSFGQNNGGYGVYFNMTMQLEKTQASFSAARSGGQTQLSGDYRKDFQDGFGTTTVGITGSRVNAEYGVNVYGTRSGTRGDASLNLGRSGGATNLDFNYRGMVAANKDGVAFGRYSTGGSAMLLSTPKIDGVKYGFNVEGNPVAGNSTYAVPVNTYNDLPFARVMSTSEKLDMNVEVPVNIVRAHPGQVYSAKAKVDINMIYSGFLKDAAGQPISGKVEETGDAVHRNGLFSIVSKTMLSDITVAGNGHRYTCSLKDADGNDFRCTPKNIE
ncbi:TcfC E-set like domain-containing protein [Burkholderia ambifaria]|uniref:TcfC E-set like domain-containing protein n=1 Tax=Burkholderia ambifaria TaxID=152480 RepID=UPI000F814385|nr:TcfC E-set like domain-containing protein [Burkholderia ambifaria]WDR86018.1 TcfC E-set like domain-containing protein [Burkholderia ambifaria]WDR98648.1 TcfC E-set like domain-containing protein [Burkholderia ambifaria]